MGAAVNAPFNQMSERQIRELANIARFRKAVNEWADRVALRASTSDEEAMLLEMELLKIGIDLWDDGDMLATLEVRREELGMDEEGYSLDDPSLVHPDNPCQRTWRGQ